ncbi:MAG: inositol monophosphatase family protein [Pseudanabaena sp. ELA607]
MSSLSAATIAQIHHCIYEAGQVALQMSSQGFDVTSKGWDDYVTNVDKHLDQLLREQFQQWFPNDAVISEENPHSVKLWHSHQGRFWFIDPIDGTSDFIQGHKFYAVMVGALDYFNGLPQAVMGWIYAPASGSFYGGGVDLATSQSVYRLESDTASPSQLIPQAITPQAPTMDQPKIVLSHKDALVYGDSIRSVIDGVSFYNLGSFGLKVMEVVLGRANAYIYLNRRVKLWDTVGPLAIARAAGLRCCDLSGEEISFAKSAIDPESLGHEQVVIVGWPEFLAAYLPQLQEHLRSDLIHNGKLADDLVGAL